MLGQSKGNCASQTQCNSSFPPLQRPPFSHTSFFFCRFHSIFLSIKGFGSIKGIFQITSVYTRCRDIFPMKGKYECGTTENTRWNVHYFFPACIIQPNKMRSNYQRIKKINKQVDTTQFAHNNIGCVNFSMIFFSLSAHSHFIFIPERKENIIISRDILNIKFVFISSPVPHSALKNEKLEKDWQLFNSNIFSLSIDENLHCIYQFLLFI